MIHSVRFKALLDANVLYPVIIRDILLWFAHHDLYTPAWSHHIFDELERIRRYFSLKPSYKIKFKYFFSIGGVRELQS